MSYCRWSSDDFQCDVYVYESADGWVTHVASNRAVFAAPVPPMADCMDVEAVISRHLVVSEMLDDATRKPIGLPHDGESFTDMTAGECADRLESLRELGYVVPQYAIDELREDAAVAQIGGER